MFLNITSVQLDQFHSTSMQLARWLPLKKLKIQNSHKFHVNMRLYSSCYRAVPRAGRSPLAPRLGGRHEVGFFKITKYFFIYFTSAKKINKIFAIYNSCKTNLQKKNIGITHKFNNNIEFNTDSIIVLS